MSTREGTEGVPWGQDKECVSKYLTVMAEHGRIQNDEILKNKFAYLFYLLLIQLGARRIWPA